MSSTSINCFIITAVFMLQLQLAACDKIRYPTYVAAGLYIIACGSDIVISLHLQCSGYVEQAGI